MLDFLSLDQLRSGTPCFLKSELLEPAHRYALAAAKFDFWTMHPFYANSSAAYHRSFKDQFNTAIVTVGCHVVR